MIDKARLDQNIYDPKNETPAGWCLSPTTRKPCNCYGQCVIACRFWAVRRGTQVHLVRVQELRDHNAFPPGSCPARKKRK